MSDTSFPYNETTNLGFITNPNIQDSALKATDRREQWLLGAYHYANSDRDETSRNASAAIFGKGTIPLDDKENSAYFLGDAMLRESGYTGSPLEYFFRQKKELPAGIKDEDSARIYLGNQLLAEMRNMYDRNIATNNETLANIDGLLDGTLKPETLTEEQLENIEATGYTLKDLITARQALEYTERGILDKLGQSLTDTAEGIWNNLWGGVKDAGKAVELLTRPVSSESGRDALLAEAGALYKHRWDTALTSASAPWRAFSDNLRLADIIRTYNGDKQVVLSLIADRLRRKAAQEYKDGNMGTRLLDVLKSEITKHAESIAMLTPENVLQADNVSDAVNAHARRASYLTFISDAIEQGRAEAMKEQGGQNWLEGGAEFGIGLLSFTNKAGLISSAIRFTQEAYGRALEALSDEQANLPDASSDELAQAAAKGAAVGAITVATRGISTRLAGRTFAKLAPKASATWGTAITSRYAGALAAEWGMSTLNFGLVLPLLDGGANAVFDAVTPFDSRLDTGVQALEQSWKDIRDLDYWGSLGTAALLWSAGGAYRTSRNSKISSRLNDIYRVNGLREAEIDKAQSIPDLRERASAMNEALTKQRKEHPGATLKHALEQSKRILTKAKQEAARKRAQDNQQDEATKATLQLYGVSAESNADPNKVDIYTGGKYSETTKQFERGKTKVTLSREDAELYLGTLMNNSFSALTERVRNVYGSDKLMEELQKLYGDRIKLETILSPEMLDLVRTRAKNAEAKVKERTKELIESTKDAEGKPTLSEAEARKRALAEVHPDIDKTRSMADLIKFGDELEKRAEIERARDKQEQNKIPVGSRAFVLSLPRKMGDAVRRILRYTKDVTTREIAEEYGEIYLEDYIANTGESYTETWRTLQLFHDSMKGEAPTLTTLTKNYPDLAQKIKDGAADADLTPVEMNNLRKDVREAMSTLLISDLRSKAQNGEVSIPVWARPLFDANLRARERMESELAFATAINEARKLGMDTEAAMRLLNVSSKELERALAEIENPTESDFYKTFQDWNQRFAEAEMRLDGLSLEQLHEFETRIAQAEQQYEAEEAAQEEKRSAPIREAIAEMETEGTTHEEAVRTVNERIIERKEKDIEENPFAQKDDAFANRTCIEITDQDGIICYSGIVNVADLGILANFKINADAETGEVHELKGDYFADHDPIRVFQATDGTLTVISGRHRLAHAKRNGATKIAAYIYKESPQQDKKWAQRRDIEWNIRDNQATPLEVALFIRGELIEGIPALTPAEMERSGMTRSGSQAYKGYIIGTKASDAVIMALRNDLIETNQAIWIAQFDSNPQVQQKGLEAALNKETKENVQLSMNIEKGRLEIMSDLGLMDTRDMLGFIIENAKLQEFTDKYTKEKIANLNARNTYLSQNSRKKSDVFAKEYEITVNNPELLKAEKNKIAELRVKWQTPYLHPELRAEIKDAFKEAYPEEWAKMVSEAKQNEAPRPAEEGLPLFPSDASLNFSIIGDHLQFWERNPDAELGELGSFGQNIEGKLQNIGEKVYDNRVTTMRNALRRRQIELQHIKKGSNDNSQKLFGEMAAIVNQLTSLLPNGYRFGLEPYIEFLTVYADLYGKGEPQRAGAALPMDGWQQIMASSFRKQVERILSDRLKPEDEVFFHELFNEAAVRIDLAGIYKELQATRRRYVDEVKERWSKTPLDSVAAKQAFEAEKQIARQEAFDDIQAKYAEEFEAAYKAIGEMRAHRLMDKFLARVIKKLDNHRKDRILGRILRAVSGLTPRKQKNGKPVHGRVEKEIHEKAVDYVRLLQLTESEKAIVDQQYADMATMKPDSIIKVTTYDKDGAEVVIETTVNEYNTYAGYETMSAEQAEAAAQSLGTFIKEGKTAWQAAEARANQEAEDFCAPMYEKWSETEAQRKARREKQSLKIWTKNKILNTFVDWFNDSQFFNICGSVEGFEPLADLTLRIASAHTYLETAEKENHDWAYNSLDTILKLEGKTKSQAAKEKRAFMTHIKTNKKCDIVLRTQAPDFAAQHQAAMRRSLLKRLFTLTRQKNFNVNKFAAAVRYIANEKLMPPELVMEVQDKYGHIGEADKYGKGDYHAYRQYFGTEKFVHLLNINQSIKERTKKSLDEWRNGKKDEAGNFIKQPANITDTHITEITPDQAAYRVLMTEQADYADMLRRQGYTPEVVNQLREIAGEQMMQYAYALRERMNARTGIIKSIYEQTFGLPFPEVENYFRAYFDVGNEGKKDASLTDLDLGIGAGEGAIEIFYTRQKHNAHISPTMDASTAYALGVKQQDNLIAYSDPQTHQHLGLFLRKIMANSKNGVRLSDVIENGLCKEAYTAMKKHTDNMFRIFRESEQTSRVLTRLFADIGSASAISTISGKFSSLLKNSMALFNTLGGSEKAGALAWYSSLGRVFTGNGKITPEQIMQEPVIRDRFKGWDYDADKAALHVLTGETAEHGATDAAPSYGMASFGAIDRYMTARSAAVLYDAVYRKLQRENKEMGHEELHALSMDEVAKALGMKGQPLDFRQRALNASRIDWRTMGSYFLGGESWNTFTNCMRLWAKANVRGKEGKQKILEASAVWLTQGAMMSLLNWGYYALTDDEEHWEKRNFLFHMLVGSAAGPISGMPIISNLAAGGLNTVGRMAGWNNMPYIGTPGFFPLVDIFRVIPAMKKAFLNKKLNWWDRAIIINDVARAASFIAMTANMRPTSKAQAATLAAGIWGSAISNGIDFVLRLGRASDERFFNFEDDSGSDND